MFILYLILIDLVGSFVVFDTASENYTVPVSGKCVLTCYVAEVRSFKVSYRSSSSSSIQTISVIDCNRICSPDVIVLFVGSTNFYSLCVCMLISNICDRCYHSRIHRRWANQIDITPTLSRFSNCSERETNRFDVWFDVGAREKKIE